MVDTLKEGKNILLVTDSWGSIDNIRKEIKKKLNPKVESRYHLIFRNKSRIDFTVNSSLYLRGRYRDVEVIYVGKRNLDPTMLFHKVQKFTPEQFEKMLKEIKESKTNIIIKKIKRLKERITEKLYKFKNRKKED